MATISHTQVKSDIWDKKKNIQESSDQLSDSKTTYSFYKIKPSGKTSATLTHTLKCFPPHTYTHTPQKDISTSMHAFIHFNTISLQNYLFFLTKELGTFSMQCSCK